MPYNYVNYYFFSIALKSQQDHINKFTIINRYNLVAVET